MKQEVKDVNVGECLEHGCKKKGEALHFCPEHYDQFKFGVIRRDGTYPKDYDKKMGDYLKHKKE